MLKLTKILTRRALSKEKLKSQKYISPNPEFLNPKNWSKTEPKSLSYTTRNNFRQTSTVFTSFQPTSTSTLSIADLPKIIALLKAQKYGHKPVIIIREQAAKNIDLENDLRIEHNSRKMAEILEQIFENFERSKDLHSVRQDKFSRSKYMHDERVLMQKLVVVFDSEWKNGENGFREKLARKRVVDEHFLQYTNEEKIRGFDNEMSGFDQNNDELTGFDKQITLQNSMPDSFSIAYDWLNIAKNHQAYSFITIDDEIDALPVSVINKINKYFDPLMSNPKSKSKRSKYTRTRKKLPELTKLYLPTLRTASGSILGTTEHIQQSIFLDPLRTDTFEFNQYLYQLDLSDLEYAELILTFLTPLSHPNISELLTTSDENVFKKPLNRRLAAICSALIHGADVGKSKKLFKVMWQGDLETLSNMNSEELSLIEASGMIRVRNGFLDENTSVMDCLEVSGWFKGKDDARNKFLKGKNGHYNKYKSENLKNDDFEANFGSGDFFKARKVFGQKVVIHYETCNVIDADKILLAETHVARNNTTLVCIGDKFRCLIRWNTPSQSVSTRNVENMPELKSGRKSIDVKALKFGVQSKILDLQQRDRAKKRSETHLNTVYAKNVENFVDNKVSANKFDDIMGLKTVGKDEQSENSVRELQHLDGLSGIARKSDSGSYMFNKMDVNKNVINDKSQNIDRDEILKSIKMKLGKTN